MKFNEFIYQKPDLEAFGQQVEQLIKKITAAADYETVKQCFLDYDNISKSVYSMAILSTIRHTIDTKDEFYKEANDFWDENSPLLSKISVDFDKAILNSPYRAQLQAEYGDPYFLMAENGLKAFSEAVMDDLVKENQLTSQYSALIASAQIEFDQGTYTLAQLVPFTQSSDRDVRKRANQARWNFFKEHQDEFDDIYDQLVKIRTTIAKKLGFENFTQLAYVRMNRLDYNQEMVETYRQQILNKVVPLTRKLYQRQCHRLGLDHLYYYDIDVSFLDGNATPVGTPDEILENGRQMYHDLSPETAEFIDLMLDNDLMDVLSKPGKSAGGYMEFLPAQKVPFIFSNFNGTSHDIDVLTHEAGHAFQGYMSRNIIPFQTVMPTYESCEIHSMSMEFLTWPYMEKFFGDKADRYRFDHLSNAVKFLPYGVLVDHFQHEVYNHPEMTPAQRRAVWAELDKLYRPDYDCEENEFLESGVFWFKQGHIFESPFYYIDYTLAQVCAFQFWKRKFVDRDPQTWEDYLKICKVGGTQSFTQICATGGLVSPFASGALDETIDAIDRYLSAIDDSKI